MKHTFTNDQRGEIMYRYLYVMQHCREIAHAMKVHPALVILTVSQYTLEGKVQIDESTREERLQQALWKIREVAGIQLAQIYYTDAELREALEEVVRIAEEVSEP